MRKDRKIIDEPAKNLQTDLDYGIATPQQETDDRILEQINKRKEENQALKKLLKNLNSITGK